MPIPSPVSADRPRPAALGVIADDLTGACDLAEQFTRSGGSATVVMHPEAVAATVADAVIVAQRNRTAPVDQARSEARAAAIALRAHGVDLLYQKYCSTFDSTATGNIGPIGDEIAAVVGAGRDVWPIGTPATPSVGRTVFGGELFVDGIGLADSSMANHPLTPMLDSDLLRRHSPRPFRRRRPRAVPGAVGDVGIDAVPVDEIRRSVAGRSATMCEIPSSTTECTGGALEHGHYSVAVDASRGGVARLRDLRTGPDLVTQDVGWGSVFAEQIPTDTDHPILVDPKRFPPEDPAPDFVRRSATTTGTPAVRIDGHVATVYWSSVVDGVCTVDHELSIGS